MKSCFDGLLCVGCFVLLIGLQLAFDGCGIYLCWHSFHYQHMYLGNNFGVGDIVLERLTVCGQAILSLGC